MTVILNNPINTDSVGFFPQIFNYVMKPVIEAIREVWNLFVQKKPTPPNNVLIDLIRSNPALIRLPAEDATQSDQSIVFVGKESSELRRIGLIANAIAKGLLEDLKYFLGEGPISDECRDDAFIDAAYMHNLNMMQVIWKNGPISEDALRKAISHYQ